MDEVRIVYGAEVYLAEPHTFSHILFNILYQQFNLFINFHSFSLQTHLTLALFSLQIAVRCNEYLAISFFRLFKMIIQSVPLFD